MNKYEFIDAVEKELMQILLTRFARTRVADYKVYNILSDPLYYAVGDGGKRIRPKAVYLGAMACGRELTDKEVVELLRLACAIELIHSYSLVHDDLPAMDNSDMRRGKPSVHAEFGESTAILVGDELLTIAAETLFFGSGRSLNYYDACREIMLAASNMAIGQAYDLKKNDDDFLRTYALKTSALLSTSFKVGAMITCSLDYDDRIDGMENFGFHIGQAFQIADDLLDPSDEHSFVAKVGEEEARRVLDEETQKAIDEILYMPHRKELEKFAYALKNRKN